MRRREFIAGSAAAWPAGAHAQQEPRKVALFSGHMIDAPGREKPRFPPDKEPVAAHAIAETLTDLEVGPPIEGVTPRRRGDSARRVRWPEQGEAEVRPLSPGIAAGFMTIPPSLASHHHVDTGESAARRSSRAKPFILEKDSAHAAPRLRLRAGQHAGPPLQLPHRRTRGSAK